MSRRTVIQRHPYMPGESDHAVLNPRQLCATCGLPRANQRHKLTPTSPEAAAVDARRLGESQD